MSLVRVTWKSLKIWDEGDSWKADLAEDRSAGLRSRTVCNFGDGGRGGCSGGG